MLELTPIDFIDSGNGKQRNVPYDLFMLILAAVLLFEKQAIAVGIVLAVWLIPKLINFIFPGLAEIRLLSMVFGVALIACMIFILIQIYNSLSM